MAIKVTQGGDFASVPMGVYPATFASMEEEVKTYDWSKNGQVYFKFNVKVGDKEEVAVYSVDAGEELRQLVKMLTKREAPRDWEQIKDVMKKAQWKGLVNVNKKGFIARLQIPTGPYSFKFGGFSHGKDGLPRVVEMQGERGPYEMIFVKHIVADGPCVGWTQDDSVGVKFTVSGSDLAINDKSSFWGLCQAIGINSDEAGDVTITEGETPLQTIERVGLRMADDGWVYGGVVNDKYRLPWDTLTKVGFGEGGNPRELENSILEKMERLYKRLYGKDEPMATGEVFTDAGKYLARNIFGVMADKLPRIGVKRTMPMQWGYATMFDVDVLFNELLEKTDNELMNLIGDSEATHTRFVEYLEQLFKQDDAGAF